MTGRRKLVTPYDSSRVVSEHDKLLERLSVTAKGSEVYPHTPSWFAGTTAVTLGNGILDGQYLRVGPLVWFKIFVEIGSTTTGLTSGTWKFGVPVVGKNDIYPFVGSALAEDVSVPTFYPGATYFDAPFDANFFAAVNSSPGQRINGTTPFTWAVGDKLTMQLQYISDM